jgi:diacylglycerol O-acyltransferase
VSPERLREIVARLMAERLHHAHPLWRIDVVEAMTDGSMAIVWRIHHCLADGTTAMRLAGQLLWSSTPDAAPVPASAWLPAPAPGGVSLLARCAAAGLGPAARRARSLGAQARGVAQARRLALESKAAVKRDLARTARPTPLDHDAGPARRIAFASAPFAACRSAAKAIDPAVTVNDVVLTAVAAGCASGSSTTGCPNRGFAPGTGEPPSRQRARRRGESRLVLLRGPPRGRAGLCRAPPGREPPDRRAQARAHEAEALYAATRRRSVARRAMSPRVFTLNVSNVPGPREDVYVLGARVSELYSVAEIAQHHALRVAVISAADTLFFGLCADRDTVDDVEVVAAGIRESLRELVAPATSG